MAKRDSGPAFMNGVPELLVLRLLAGGEMYGYQLVQAIRFQSAETFTFGEGVIYSVLHALEQSRALKTRQEKINGRTRVYYRVTAAGQRRLGELSATWVKVAQAIQGILQGGTHAEAI
ncbi:MAG: PadR family transcriptional regulator [Rhodospirillaceae bacterium]